MASKIAEERQAALVRDGRCFVSMVDRSHVCKDVWGQVHPSDRLDLLTADHVKFELRLGKKAPDDRRFLVAMCAAANIAVPSKQLRQQERDYLRRLYPETHG